MFAFSLISTLIASSFAQEPEWSYRGDTGPAFWPVLFTEFCAGENQSPIDIGYTKYNGNLGRIHFIGYNQTPKDARINNTDNTVEVIPNVRETYGISGGGLTGTYRLVQSHFHWGSDSSQGSEHTIGGRRYPLEAHFVHYKEEYGSMENALNYPDGLAVLAVLFRVSHTDNHDFDAIINALPAILYAETSTTLDLGVPLRSLLPNTDSCYYRYTGSLTTPTCNEVVIWTVFCHKQEISERQLNAFRKVLEGKEGEEEFPLADNFRPVQDLGDRTVTRSCKF